LPSAEHGEVIEVISATKLLALEDRIRQLLIDYWDPIGLGGYPRNEYDAYGRAICSMIVNSRAREFDDFADYLSKVTEDMMGLRPEPDRIQLAAKELLALRREVRADLRSGD